MEDDCPIWSRLTNYTPFETEVCNADPVFNLELVPKSYMDNIKMIPVYVEKSPEEDQPRIEIYHRGPDETDPSGESWVIDMAPVQKMPICARLLASPDFSQGKLAIANDKIGEFAINNAAMILYAFTTATRGTLEMHSSVIKNNGKGYMFLGKSGTGKSTHSSLWLKYIPGSVLLNDDNPILKVDSDGIIRVYGSPWSGKTPCYKNDCAQVGAIVRLNQHPENIITPNSVIEAYAAIYPSCSGFRSVTSIADGMHKTIENIVLNIPCFTLDCLPDEAAAVLCHDTVTA